MAGQSPAGESRLSLATFPLRFAAAASLCLAASTPAHAITRDEPPAPIEQTAPASFAWPKLRIAPRAPQGEEDFAAWYGQELARLQTAAESAELPLKKAEAHSAAANHLLSHGLAVAATCRLLQVPVEATAGCGGRPDEVLDAADEHLRKATEILAVDAEKNGLVDPAQDERAALTTKHELLSAFATALRVAMSDQSDLDARRAAASRLSPLRESDDAGTAAAAGLWQAFIRSAEEDKGPAESILGNPAAVIRPGALPHAFFSKLLRARLIDQGGSPGAALAVLLHVEDRTGEWFSPEHDEIFRNACRWSRLRILHRWQARLSDPAMEMERQWCKERMDELLLDLSGEPELAAISPAIPAIVAVEAAKAPPADTPVPEIEPVEHPE